MINRILFVFSVWLLMLISAFAVPTTGPVAVFHLESHPGGTHMMTLQASVQGHTGRFIFDTGGGISYISPAFAQSIGCRPWGQLSGFVLTGQRLDMQRCDSVTIQIQNQAFKAPTVGVFDIGKFMPPDAPKIDGSIGLDLLVGRAITLSLADQTLTIESSASLKRRIKTSREISIRLVREVQGLALSVVTGVRTSEGTAWMELDSGNGGPNVVAKHIALIFGLKSGKEPQPATFYLVGGIPVTGSVRVNDTLIMDGNIGTRFLIDWELTLDLAHGRGWLRKAEKVNR